MSDQALVDTKDVETFAKACNEVLAGMREPRMNRLVPGVNDGGEVPSAIFIEPPDDCETLSDVPVEVGLIARLPVFPPVEVEDHKRAC